MKTMNRIFRSFVAAGLALAAFLPGGASANLITYQVNLGVQAQLGNFNPANGDLVRVAGNFSPVDWATTNILTPSAGDPDIWEGTFNSDIAAGGFVNYKFIIDVGGFGSTLNWELGGNRFFQATAEDQVLPVVYFNNVSDPGNITTRPVTFAVNMGVQMALGNFNPGNGEVIYVAGDPLNNWMPGVSVLAPDSENPELYVGTFNITSTVGTTVNYKFIMDTFAGTQWEINGVGPNGAQNRQFTFTNEATVLPAVYFNNVSSPASQITTQITFTVSLAAQIARGEFDPNSGTVSVAGDAINNWSAIASPLAPVPESPSLWTGTFDLTANVGSPVNYKFVLGGGATWEANGVGPNGANDRQFLFPDAALALPVVHFENLNHLGPLTLGPITGGQVAVSWTAGPLIRLQTNSVPTGVWTDVPDTTGGDNATVNVGAGNLYFRLTGPW
jgi:hypothetical protein